MKVAEKDNVVQGMLDDEYVRCLDVIKALQAKMESYPKGALNIRRKKIKDKEYIYYYLVWREGKDVINRHVAADNLPQLQKQIADRNKLRNEILAYKERLAYLKKLLNKSVPGKKHD
jgi:hypothetical protein